MSKKKIKSKKVPVTVDGITLQSYPDLANHARVTLYIQRIERGGKAAEDAATRLTEYILGDDIESVIDALDEKSEDGYATAADLGAFAFKVIEAQSKNSDGS